jgi:protein AFG1
VINLDSPTDYRKIPRPSKNVYFSPLDQKAQASADQWFEYFGGQPLTKAKPAELELWGRKYNPIPSILILDWQFQLFSDSVRNSRSMIYVDCPLAVQTI